MDTAATSALIIGYWEAKLLPLLNNVLAGFAPLSAQFMLLVQKQPYLLATIVAGFAGVLTLLIGLWVLRRGQRRYNQANHTPHIISPALQNHVPELDGLRSTSGAQTHDIANRFASSTPSAPPPSNPALDIPRVGADMPATTTESTARTRTTPPSPPLDNDLGHLAEAERKLHALRELYQAGLIAPEIYILKAREYAAIIQ